MECKKCGTEAAEAKVCPNCGADVAEETPVTKQEEQENTTLTEKPEDATPAEVAEPVAVEGQPEQKPAKKKKKPVVVLSAIAAVVLIIIISVVASNNKMTPEEKEAVSRMVASIDELPQDITIKDKDRIISLEVTYYDFTEKQQKKVKNHNKLERASEALDALMIAQAEDAIQSIGTVTLQSGEAIKTARELFDGLTEMNQEKVKSADVLSKAIKEYDKLCAARVDEMITNLDVISLDRGKEVVALAEAYEALSDEAKKLVVKKGEYDTALELYNGIVREYEVNHSIKVTYVGVSSTPNKDGYIDARILFTNVSDKVISKVVFTVVPHDANHTRVYLSGSNKMTRELPYDYPVNPNSSTPSFQWSNAFKNPLVAGMLIAKVDITYIDGSKLVLDDLDEIDCILQ